MPPSVPHPARRIATLLVRLGLSALFLWAGLLKLRDPEGTQVAVHQYKLLSWEASEVAATCVPLMEVVAAVGLWIPRVRLGAVALCMALLLCFMGALGSAVARNLDVSCGCFGTSTLHSTALRRLGEDLLLLALCLPLWNEAARGFRARGESVTVKPQKDV